MIDVAPGDFDNDGLHGSLRADGGRSAAVSQHRRQIRSAAGEPSRPALRCRRMDRLRSRLRPRSHPAGTAAGAIAESGSGGMGGSDRGFPVRERRSRPPPESCAWFPTARRSTWPCSIAIARRCCIAINWAADTPWRRSRATRHAIGMQVDADFDANRTAGPRPHRCGRQHSFHAQSE